jgi:ABC-type Zn2+ transport system substrate-binding protein/surface adhesin
LFWWGSTIKIKLQKRIEKKKKKKKISLSREETVTKMLNKFQKEQQFDE